MYRDMILIAALGQALDVDPFTQPHVHTYKKDALQQLVNLRSTHSRTTFTHDEIADA